MEKTLRKQLKALDIRPPLANNDINSILSLLSAHIKAKALTDEQIQQIPVPEGYDREMAIAHAVAAAQLQAVLGELE